MCIRDRCGVLSRSRRSRLPYADDSFLSARSTIGSVTVVDLSPPPSRARLWWEIAIVLALGLGQSAVYAIVQLAYRLTDETPLADQTATLNPSRSDREIFDLIYQVLSIGFSLVPVLLVCFLLWQSSRPHLSRLGLDGTRVGADVGRGILLVAAIGTVSYTHLTLPTKA